MNITVNYRSYKVKKGMATKTGSANSIFLGPTYSECLDKESGMFQIDTLVTAGGYNLTFLAFTVETSRSVDALGIAITLAWITFINVYKYNVSTFIEAQHLPQFGRIYKRRKYKVSLSLFQLHLLSHPI